MGVGAAVGAGVPFAHASGTSVPPFTPADIPNLWARLDALNVASVRTGVGGASQAAVNDPVSEWRDLSGNARHAAQATGAKQPVLALSGDRRIQFAGGDDALNIADNLTQPCSVFVTGAWDSIAQTAMVDSAASQDCAFYLDTGATQYLVYAGASLNPGPTANTNRHTFLIVLNGASSYIRMDGGAKFTGDPGAGVYTGVRLGNTLLGAAGLPGHIAESAFYTGVVSDANADLFFAYAAAKWGT